MESFLSLVVLEEGACHASTLRPWRCCATLGGSPVRVAPDACVVRAEF